VLWCYLPRSGNPEGGGWFTTFQSHGPEPGGDVTLYRRGPLGTSIRVDDRVFVRRFYSPDCILYEPGRDAGVIYAACGNRAPVALASYPPWSMRQEYEATGDGLRRTDTVRVIDGRAVATVEQIPIAEIRRVAEAQPRLMPGWRHRAGPALDVLPPAIHQEPLDVRARGIRGESHLFEAVRRDQRDVAEALLRHGADANATDSVGITPLLMAVGAMEPDTALVQLLLNARADPNIPDHTGATPLIRATINKQIPVVRLLLRKGADPCRRDEEGKSIMDWIAGPFPELQQMVQAAYRRCVPRQG
jgi:ankyrin repeat protein